MPAGKTNFSVGWLTKLDNNGHVLSKWCEPDTKCCYSGDCKPCGKSISSAKNGIQRIINHGADGLKHKSNMKAKPNKGQHV